MNETIDVLVKLFDTLKESSDENKRTCQAMIAQQQDLVNIIKLLPINDLRDNLKEHSKQSDTDIETCTTSVETNSIAILQKIKDIDGKINKMLIVIGVVFSLLAVAYFIARSTTDVNDIKKEIKKEFVSEQEKMKNEITRDIEAKQRREHQEIIDAVTKAIRDYKNTENKNEEDK
jgi:hypothetical protein